MTARNALGALHIGALLFGLTGVFGKLAAASASVIVFGRAGFAVIALACFAAVSRRSPWHALTRRDVRSLLVSGLLLAGHWVSFFIAVKVAGVAIATLGFASFPAFTVLLEGLIFRERIRLNEIMLVVLVSVGLILVTPTFDLASQATEGLLWAIASGLTFSLLSLNNRANAGRVPAVQAAMWQNAVPACRAVHRRRAQPVRRQPGGDQSPHGGGRLRPGAGVWHHPGVAVVPRNPDAAHAAGRRADYRRDCGVKPYGPRRFTG